MVYPYAVTDTKPEIYECLKEVSPFHSARSATFRIAIHVRRGEELAVDSNRMLPNSYYIASTMRIVAALKQLGIPFVCELYTEIPSKAFVVTPHSQGINGRLSAPVVIDPKMNRIEEFDVIPNLHKCINLDAIESLRGMATADALIISRSSFSYLAALFSKGIVIYYPFWHRPLKEWLTSDSNGNLPSDELLRQLQSWKAQSPQVPQR
jgi:predicted Fe-Mo cluster-binding NifX family protein